MKTTLYRTATEEDRIETQKLVSETGRRCVAVEADVRDRPAMKAFVARTIDELGPIDIVLANAGITAFGTGLGGRPTRCGTRPLTSA